MKHTEQQITALTQKRLKDIQFDYFENQPFLIKETNNKAILGRNSKITNGIIVGVYWYDSEYLGGNNATAFLTINDETGEPETFSIGSGGGGIWLIDKDNQETYYSYV